MYSPPFINFFSSADGLKLPYPPTLEFIPDISILVIPMYAFHSTQSEMHRGLYFQTNMNLFGNEPSKKPLHTHEK